MFTNSRSLKFTRIAGKSDLQIIGIVLVGTLMSVLDAVMVSIALPMITTEFSVPVALSQWVISGYVISMTCLLLSSGITTTGYQTMVLDADPDILSRTVSWILLVTEVVAFVMMVCSFIRAILLTRSQIIRTRREKTLATKLLCY